MHAVRIVAAMAALFLVSAHAADAAVVVTVDKTAQRMTVAVDGWTQYQWPISTARWGYNTPNGRYRPEWMARKWFSRKYDNSPMPHSIFFHGGFAIHGSYEISHLGRPASHGCIRLLPANAAQLYALVQREGMAATTIVVTGAPAPPPAPRAQRAQQLPLPIAPPVESPFDFLRNLFRPENIN